MTAETPVRHSWAYWLALGFNAVALGWNLVLVALHPGDGPGWSCVVNSLAIFAVVTGEDVRQRAILRLQRLQAFTDLDIALQHKLHDAVDRGMVSIEFERAADGTKH